MSLNGKYINHLIVKMLHNEGISLSSLFQIILHYKLYYLIFRIKSLFIVDLIGRKLLHLHKESPPSFQHPNFCQVTHLLMNEQERVSPNFFKSAVSSHYLHPKYILNTQVLSNLSRWMGMKCQKKLTNFIWITIFSIFNTIARSTKDLVIRIMSLRYISYQIIWSIKTELYYPHIWYSKFINFNFSNFSDIMGGKIYIWNKFILAWNFTMVWSYVCDNGKHFSDSTCMWNDF